MANAAALINEGLWRKDKDFQRLPRLAQCTFCQVLSQRDLDTAGVLTLHLDLLAKGCDELTPDQLREDFAVLEASRFLFVDYDTDELFIRSYVRNVSVKNRNSWHSVPKNSLMVASSKIRRELAAELRRLRRKDASDIADEIDPPDTPSGPGRDGVGTGSEHGTGSEPARDGDSQVQVQVLVSRNVVGSFGEEPSPFCKDHPNGTDTKCFACGQARRSHPERLAKWESETRKARAEARQAAINACTLCDEFGDLTFDDAVKRCTHPNPEEARNA
jgi:hypothetical protein